MTLSGTLTTLILLISLVRTLNAQFVIHGRFEDKKDKSSLIGVGVVLVNEGDTTVKSAVQTDLDGNFEFKNISAGTYVLRTTYIGYNSLSRTVVVAGKDIDLGVMQMEQSSIALKEVNVKGTQLRTEQSGDTTSYNANAFKVNKDANVEDLVNKMPGVTTENGVVKAHGENVKRVLIDGKEFFGDDASIALKNLPAEVVDKIQVFDRLSEQARFTGIDDGNSEKTINIVTKPGRNQGVFGKVFAGYGTDERYQAGGNINSFKGNRKITLVGLTNNINQQNFSAQDLSGIASGGGQGRGGGGRGGQGNAANNFLVGQQGGINTTNSVGLNYAGSWGKKMQVNGSYFFNNTRNINNGLTTRDYFLSRNFSQFYNENSASNSNNHNHRANLRIEYNMDSSNSIILVPSFSFQDNNAANAWQGLTNNSDSIALNRTNNRNNTGNLAYNFNNNAIFRHKFTKKGRTISVNLGTSANNSDSRLGLFSLNQFYFPSDTNILVDQRTNATGKSYTLSSDLVYTEPISKNTSLQFNYTPSYNNNRSERRTLTPDVTGIYSLLDTSLSNTFDNRVMTHRGGVTYRIGKEKFNFFVRLNYQYTELEGQRLFPGEQLITKHFNNALPSARFSYKFSKSSEFRVFYRTNIIVPSVNQLQNVINNTNPLLLTTGNPDLKQQFSHNINTRYNLSIPEKGRTLVALFTAAYTDNYIGNATSIARRDTVLPGGLILLQGSKLTRPVNLDGNWNLQSYLTYGLPVSYIKCNLNISGGGGYIRIPGLVNDRINYSNTYNFTGGVVLSSNISEKLDFKLSYTPNYNIVKNTIQPQSDNNYLIQTTSVKANWQPWKGLVLGSDISRFQYSGLGTLFNQDILLWNASIGYKFLKNEAADFRLIVFDILGQNNSINRIVTETYIENNQTQVLRQYFMAVFTYTIRNFKAKQD